MYSIMRKMDFRYPIKLSRFLRELEEAEHRRKKIRSLHPRVMKLWLEAYKVKKQLPKEVMGIFVAAVENEISSHEKCIQVQKEKRNEKKSNSHSKTSQENQNSQNSRSDHFNQQSTKGPADNEYSVLLRRFRKDLSDISAGKQRRSLKPRAMKLWLVAHHIGKKLAPEIIEIFAQAVEQRVNWNEKRTKNQKQKRQAQKAINHRWNYRERRYLYTFINQHISASINSESNNNSLKTAIYKYIDYRTSEDDNCNLDFDVVASEYNRQLKIVKEELSYKENAF